MALTKQTIVDKIEIVSKHKIIQVRESTQIMEDNVVISENYHRYCINPGESSTDPTISAVITAVHTQDVIDAYQAHLAAQTD